MCRCFCISCNHHVHGACFRSNFNSIIKPIDGDATIVSLLKTLIGGSQLQSNYQTAYGNKSGHTK